MPKFNALIDGGLSMPHHYGVARSTDMSVRMMITMELPLFSGGATLAAIKQKAAHRTISELIDA